MRTQTGVALSLALFWIPACGAKERHGDAAGVEVEIGRAPRVSVDERPTAEPSEAPRTAVPEPSPKLEPTPAPELDERELALANVGRAAFDALKAGEFDSLLALTPFHKGFLRDACPHMSLGNRRELQARFDHCHQTIPWKAVAEAQVFAGEPTGAPAGGCEDGIEDYGRLQLFVHLRDATIWRVDFLGAVGQDGNAIGINGELSCREVDEAPSLGGPQGAVK